MESVRVSENAHQDNRCSYCHDSLADKFEVSCPGCQTKLCSECFQGLEECPTLGCGMKNPSKSSEPERRIVPVVVPVETPVEAEHGIRSGLKILFRRCLLAVLILFIVAFVDVLSEKEGDFSSVNVTELVLFLLFNGIPIGFVTHFFLYFVGRMVKTLNRRPSDDN